MCYIKNVKPLAPADSLLQVQPKLPLSPPEGPQKTFGADFANYDFLAGLPISASECAPLIDLPPMTAESLSADSDFWLSLLSSSQLPSSPSSSEFASPSFGSPLCLTPELVSQSMFTPASGPMPEFVHPPMQAMILPAMSWPSPETPSTQTIISVPTPVHCTQESQPANSTSASTGSSANNSNSNLTSPPNSNSSLSSHNDQVPSQKPNSRKRQSDDDDDDDHDDDTVRRRKNTEAARRSRQRKVAKLESLEKQSKDLERENAQLSIRLAVLESEKVGWIAKEAELMARIRQLEEQLAESHKALLEFGMKSASGML
ncbi:uncharacterized protein BJ171DRAFT_492426 [Polychytrium aggregatum]|uniref:uncharacterized protein n=1 Tax=Polychytrium aggregatum TaxID=110093 RepID=UPI0022FF3E7C|nr:uncharacterized protein BJ171DRAFT_492426 [Polychytrium aggregatum]KAI9208029.1 hypothetical protein BJ171DRAFT_492426 [Polychytrium aggregatum]